MYDGRAALAFQSIPNLEVDEGVCCSFLTSFDTGSATGLSCGEGLGSITGIFGGSRFISGSFFIASGSFLISTGRIFGICLFGGGLCLEVVFLDCCG